MKCKNCDWVTYADAGQGIDYICYKTGKLLFYPYEPCEQYEVNSKPSERLMDEIGE